MIKTDRCFYSSLIEYNILQRQLNNILARKRRGDNFVIRVLFMGRFILAWDVIMGNFGNLDAKNTGN